METERIRRQEHFRTIGVHAFPQPGVLASEVLKDSHARSSTPSNATSRPAIACIIGGEQAKQEDGFANLAKVLLISMLGIYAALLLQFNNAVKPSAGLRRDPLRRRRRAARARHHGIAFRLHGVSRNRQPDRRDRQPRDRALRFHRRNAREAGEPFQQAICDAGIERLRPVLITVGATILALFPLASHGGPLWKPLCYAQIGGLAVATFITLPVSRASTASPYWI